MTVHTEVLHPVGAVVTGVQLAAATAPEVDGLRTVLAVHGAVILPDQDIDDAAFVAALRRFGELTFTPGETPVDGCADLNVVTNVGRTTPPKSTFHVDTSYVRRPPIYTALRAVTVPRRGGETLFTNQYRAWATLDPATRDRLRDRVVTHRVTGLSLGPGEETEAEHPLVRTHPISGNDALYLSTPARCVAVSGMTPADAGRTVSALFQHSTDPDNVHRHAWSPGEVVIWDNRCVMHRADHADVSGDRVLHRGLVAG
jgi:taurine dioxygenase